MERPWLGNLTQRLWHEPLVSLLCAPVSGCCDMSSFFWYDPARALAHLFWPSSSIVCWTLPSALCGDCGAQVAEQLSEKM